MIFQSVNISKDYLYKKKEMEFNLPPEADILSKRAIQISELNHDSLNVIKTIFSSENIHFFKNSKEEKNSFKCLILTDLEKMKHVLTTGSHNLTEDIRSGFNDFFENSKNFYHKKIYIHDRIFSYNKKYIAGIVNVTPDSFSDGGLYSRTTPAVKHALKLLDDGADILDIGGESSRPGAIPVSEKEELGRVIPVIEEIVSKKKDVLISIDTSKSEVAKMALSAGASMVNDISGLTFDSKMAEVVADFNAALILMHIKGTPQDMQKNPSYEDVIDEIYLFLRKQSDFAKSFGITNIILDPGIGFGKKVCDNFEILDRLGELKGIGFPLMIGLSKKSFIGKLLNLNVNERENSTIAAEMVSMKNGASFIRTHNVKNLYQAREILYSTENPDKIINV